MPNSQQINVANIATTLPMTPGSCVPFNVPGPGGGQATLQITGTYVGQVAVAESLDGINFTALPNSNIQKASDDSFGIAANATGIYRLSVDAGNIYVFLSSYVSGIATVTVSVGAGGGGGSGNSFPSGSIPVGKATTLLAASQSADSGLYITGAHNVGRVIGDNASSTTYYLMLFDSLTLPADTTVPVFELTVPFGVSTAPTENEEVFTPNWLAFATGVYWAWSSTAGSLTHITGVTGLLVRCYGS